jgi:hypothetical protein
VTGGLTSAGKTTARDGLQAFDIDAFVAHETIAPTTAWQDEIEHALATCHACAAILSDGFKETNQTVFKTEHEPAPQACLHAIASPARREGEIESDHVVAAIEEIGVLDLPFRPDRGQRFGEPLAAPATPAERPAVSA